MSILLPSSVSPALSDRPRLSWLVIVAAWTVPAALSAFETVMFARTNGHPIAVWRAFAAEAPGWYVWAALTPVIVGLGQRIPLDRRLRVSALSGHLAASLVASVIVAVVSASADVLLRPSSRGLVGSIRSWFLSGLPATTLAYFSVLGISYALLNTARLRARERHAEQLAAQLTDAQLSALKMQLQPHFLFNSLNAIMALVRDQHTSGAIRALSLLSDLLRTSLRADASKEVPLEAEIEFVQRYLAMEQIRFGDRLIAEYSIADEALDLAVPTFILQPLVENALRHGLARSRAVGRVEIRASTDGQALSLVVEDDGKGLPLDWRDHQSGGLGIANTRARLAHMYGSAGRLTIERGVKTRGVIATITLPCRRAAIAGQSAPAPQPALVSR